jgi:hypothetical protein
LMSSRVAFILFRWLIFVSTLCDPWFIIILLMLQLQTSKFFNRWPCASYDAEAGFFPFQKNNHFFSFWGLNFPLKCTPSIYKRMS